MTYTADFATIRQEGDMFQSINGDVWTVSNIIGIWRGRQRATVTRIWRYTARQVRAQVTK